VDSNGCWCNCRVAVCMVVDDRWRSSGVSGVVNNLSWSHLGLVHNWSMVDWLVNADILNHTTDMHFRLDLSVQWSDLSVGADWSQNSFLGHEWPNCVSLDTDWSWSGNS